MKRTGVLQSSPSVDWGGLSPRFARQDSNGDVSALFEAFTSYKKEQEMVMTRMKAEHDASIEEVKLAQKTWADDVKAHVEIQIKKLEAKFMSHSQSTSNDGLTLTDLQAHVTRMTESLDKLFDMLGDLTHQYNGDFANEVHEQSSENTADSYLLSPRKAMAHGQWKVIFPGGSTSEIDGTKSKLEPNTRPNFLDYSLFGPQEASADDFTYRPHAGLQSGNENLQKSANLNKPMAHCSDGWSGASFEKYFTSSLSVSTMATGSSKQEGIDGFERVADVRACKVI